MLLESGEPSFGAKEENWKAGKDEWRPPRLRESEGKEEESESERGEAVEEATAITRPATITPIGARARRGDGSSSTPSNI